MVKLKLVHGIRQTLGLKCHWFNPVIKQKVIISFQNNLLQLWILPDLHAHLCVLHNTLNEKGISMFLAVCLIFYHFKTFHSSFRLSLSIHWWRILSAPHNDKSKIFQGCTTYLIIYLLLCVCDVYSPCVMCLADSLKLIITTCFKSQTRLLLCPIRTLVEFTTY